MRTIQEILLAFSAVINHHGKASRSCNDALLQLLVGVSTANGAGRHIVKVIHAPDPEGDVTPAFDERKIAAMVSDLGEVYDPDSRAIYTGPGRRIPGRGRKRTDTSRV